MTENVKGYAEFQLQTKTNNGEWENLGSVVSGAYSYNTASVTFDVAPIAAGTTYRVLVSSADGLEASNGGASINFTDQSSAAIQ